MNIYTVIAGKVRYNMAAASLRHAVAFTKHWPSVRIVRARPLSGASHIPKFQPGVYIVGTMRSAANEYARGPSPWVTEGAAVLTFPHGAPYLQVVGRAKRPKVQP